MIGEVVAGKRTTILGMARSGMALALLLKKYGADVFVSEMKRDERILKESTLLKASGIECELGGHTARVLDSDLIAISPGIPMDIVILKKASSKGIPVFSELEVSSWFCKAPILAVTGSNGKTTTTTLLGKIIADSGRDCVVGGNIGIPFASVVEKVEPSGYAVLEISSFQLEGIEKFQPRVAMILNFTPDHLDRYSTIDEYRLAKERIYENMGVGDYLILNADDPESQKFIPAEGVKVLRFSIRPEGESDAFVDERSLILRTVEGTREVISTDRIGIPGPHNLANSAAAALAASVIGVDIPGIARTLQDFKGVEHRLEKVAVINGVTFINDSKATNVDAVAMALKSVESRIILIAGGRDKGGDFRELTSAINEKVCALILIGEATDKIVLQLSKAAPIYRAKNIAKAVVLAAGLARKGETVLLSPGCASFDMFRDYEHRGDVFKEEVGRLKQSGARV